MKIVVIGGDGRLGTELCRQAPDAVPLAPPELDLTRPASIRAVLSRIEPEAVINAAAYTQVDEAEANPDLCHAVNAEAVAQVAAVCQLLDCPLVQISTDYVFGGDVQDRHTPYRETDPPVAVGVYAQSKLAGERCAAEYPRHFIVRTCGLYGPSGPGTPKGDFVETMLRLGSQRDVLRVVADQHCTPSYAVHVAGAILFLLSTDRYGTYHVTNQGETTWHEFGREIFRLADMPIKVEPITTAQYGAAAPRPAYSVLDVSKYHSLSGPPMPTWQQALAEYLQHLGRLQSG